MKPKTRTRDRPRYCTAYACKNTSRKPELNFFTLPMDRVRQKEWCKAIHREDVLLKDDFKPKSYVVCSEHFEETAFKLVRLLKKDAVPSKLSPDQVSHFQQSTSDVSTQTVYNGINVYNPHVQIPSKVKPKETVIIKIESDSSNSEEESDDSETRTTTIATSQKRQLTDKIDNSKHKPKRLDHEFEKFSTELEIENVPIIYNEPDDEICIRFRKLIAWQNKLTGKFKGNLYSAEYRQNALHFYYSSPYAYRCLQTALKLPNKSILSKFKVNRSPTFDDQVLESLKLKMQSLPDNARYCTICIDKMALKKNLFYNINADEVTGFHNINGMTSTKFASNAYVLMLQGISFQWNQPIAYALLDSAEHFDELDAWLKEVISKLSEIEIDVKAVISDQDSNFDKFAKEVKHVTVKKPFFTYDEKRIYYIFEVPQLIKCLRDSLLINNFHLRGNEISWDYIKQLYEDQKEKKFRLIPKVTASHIAPNNLNKTQLEYAVQIFSGAVSTALHTYIDFDNMSEDARPTAKFIEAMNNLFDVLNSSKPMPKSKFQTAHKLTKEEQGALTEAQEIFSNIKALNKKTGNNDTENLKLFVNIQISIQSIKMLHEDLEAEGITSLLTRRLNLDNMEMLLDSIREQSGSQEPTPIQFRRAFSDLFLSHMLRSPPHATEVFDICEVLLRAEDIMCSNYKSTSSSKPSDVYLSGETDYRMDLPKENALTYVAAYLLFKCKKKHKCPTFDKVLKSNVDEEYFFSRYENLNQHSGFIGNLTMPPDDFMKYVQHLESALTNNFELISRKNPGKLLLFLLQSLPPMTPCPCFPTDYLIKLFVRLRMYETLKRNVQNMKNCSDESRNELTVRHLYVCNT